jgi:hypothetical protein
MALKPATATGTMAASEPPASMASALLCRIISAASPMAFELEAHAVTTAMFGPRRPKAIAS